MAKKTCAIVCATTKWHENLGLESVPQAEVNCKRLCDFLESSHAPEITHEDLFFALNPTMDWIYKSLDTCIERRPSQFIFYYCGHGELGHNTELIFPLQSTEMSSLYNASLNAEILALKIKNIGALSFVLIDTCRSARFLSYLSGYHNQIEKSLQNFHDDKIFAIAAAAQYAKNMHPQEKEMTFFTGECVRQIEEWIITGNQSLTAKILFEGVKKKIRELEGPTPWVKGDGSKFILINNSSPHLENETKQVFPRSQILWLPNKEILAEPSNSITGRNDYGFQRVPFIKSSVITQRLHDFLYSPNGKQISWMVIEGIGGAGKSRLAYELCLEAKDNNWDAGFFYPSENQILSFPFQQSTLVIFDDAETTFLSAKNLLFNLSSNQPPPGIIVRVILLTRGRHLLLKNEAQLPWWRQFQDGNYKQTLISLSEKLDFEASTLRIPELSDNEILEIVKIVVGKYGKKIDNPDIEILESFSKIDCFRRPLFATFFAEAIAINGFENARQWDRLTLITDCLNREKGPWEKHNLNSPEFGSLLTFSCVAGKEGLGICKKASERNLGVPDAPNIQILSGLIGYNTWDGESLIPLEPDILGELLVLLRLKGQFVLQIESPNEVAQKTKQIIQFIVENKTERGIEFLRRCISDFPYAELVTVISSFLRENKKTVDLTLLGEIIDSFSENRLISDAKQLVDFALQLKELKKIDIERLLFILRKARIYDELGRISDCEKDLLDVIESGTFSHRNRYFLAEAKVFLSDIFLSQGQLNKADKKLNEVEKLRDLPNFILEKCYILRKKLTGTRIINRLETRKNQTAKNNDNIAQKLLDSMRKKVSTKIKLKKLKEVMQCNCSDLIKYEANIIVIEAYIFDKKNDAAILFYEKSNEIVFKTINVPDHLLNRKKRIESILF